MKASEASGFTNIPAMRNLNTIFQLLPQTIICPLLFCLQDLFYFFPLIVMKSLAVCWWIYILWHTLQAVSQGRNYAEVLCHILPYGNPRSAPESANASIVFQTIPDRIYLKNGCGQSYSVTIMKCERTFIHHGMDPPPYSYQAVC